jgi:hypothetical protein
MQTWEYILIAGAIILGIFALAMVGGVIGAWLFRRQLEARISSLEARRGREGLTAANDRLESAITEAAALYQSGTKPEEILKTLLPKYPDVALKLGKKLGKIDLGDIKLG